MSGLHAPSWAQLGRRGAEVRQLPLKVKDVCGVLQLDRLLSLDMSPKTHLELQEALLWVTDSAFYTTMGSEIERGYPLRSTRSRFLPTDVVELQNVGKFVRPSRPMLAGMNAFTVVDEKVKADAIVATRRPILEPIINDLVKELWSSEVSVEFTPKDDIREQVLQSTHAIQFDMTSWFDQIPISEAIRHFFGYNADNCLSVLAMGYAPSVRVAQSILNALIPDPLPDAVGVASRVDNLRFTGNPADVELAGRLFEARCAQVGAKIGEKSEVDTSYEFLGECYDHEKKTRCLTAKTVSKAEFVRDALLESKSRPIRQILAFVGLLRYTADVLDIAPAAFYHALREAAGFAATGALSGYDSPVTLSDAARLSLHSWAALAAANAPTAVHRPLPTSDPDITIFVDASAWGWAAVSWTRGAVWPEVIAQPWSAQELSTWNLGSSVAAEPLAFRKALKACVSTRFRHVRIFTDHQPLVYATARHDGRAFAYALASVDLHELRKTTHVEVHHVPGELNPADQPSRGLKLAPGCELPPCLHVTHIAGRRVSKCSRNGGMG